MEERKARSGRRYTGATAGPSLPNATVSNLKVASPWGGSLVALEGVVLWHIVELTVSIYIVIPVFVTMGHYAMSRQPVAFLLAAQILFGAGSVVAQPPQEELSPDNPKLKALKAAKAYASALWPDDSANYILAVRSAAQRALEELQAVSLNRDNSEMAVTRLGGGGPAMSIPDQGFGPAFSDAERTQGFGPTQSTAVAPRGGVIGDKNYIRTYSKDISRYVWGGRATSGSEYSDVVAILKNGAIWCTGTLIDPDVVLTASHCGCEKKNPASNNPSMPVDISLLTVYLGPDLRATNPLEPPPIGILDRVQKLPCNSPLSGGDIAVLRLKERTTVSRKSLASNALIDRVSEVRVVGYGQTENNTSGERIVANVPIANHDCSGKVLTVTGREIPAKDYYDCKTGFEIVAGDMDLGKGACHGDSGGPIFAYDDDQKQFALAGVTSRFVQKTKSCGNGSVYARVNVAIVAPLLAALKKNN